MVNIGPGLRTTADGQTQSRSGPRNRQRGAVLPHKYIVKLKNGADFSSRKSPFVGCGVGDCVSVA